MTNICRVRRPREGIYNYAQALQKAIYFYMQQRSGHLPEDNPVTWRGDSCLNNGADVGFDLTGGYFDAGDHVKFALPMASTIATIAWAISEFKAVFEQSMLLDNALDAIKWGADFFIKCHPQPNEFYFQVGDGHLDHKYWVPAEIIDQVTNRPAYKGTFSHGATTAVAATAAALAFTSIIFHRSNQVYAEESLRMRKICTILPTQPKMTPIIMK